MRAGEPEHGETDGTPEGHARPDVGTTLVEVVVAITLIGAFVGVLLSGLWTVIRISKFSDDQAKVEAVIGSAADRLANYAYIPCPATAANGGYLPIVQAAAGTVDWAGTTVSIDSILYWSPATSSTGSWTASNNLASSQCSQSVGLTTSKTLQRVTIRVVSPQTGYTRTIQVVKNNVFPKSVSA